MAISRNDHSVVGLGHETVVAIEEPAGAVWRSLLPGMLDVGLASIATFAVGLYAAHSLDTAEFGIYALFISAFIFAAVVPAYLVLSPAAFAAVLSTSVRRQRLNLVGQTWRLGAPAAFLAGGLACLVAGLAAEAPARIVVPLAVTCAACSAVSPLQDHVRQILHMGSSSWSAVVVSVVQLIGVGVSLELLAAGGIPAPWRPFGALAIANTLSLVIGIELGRRQAYGSLPRFEVRTLTRSGRWLVMHHLGLATGFFGSTAIVTALAGRTAVGHTEAARLVAQPLYVLISGLGAITWHMSMTAGERRNAAEAHRVARTFIGMLVIAGVGYAVVTARPWWGNPFPRLLPEAYTNPGLVVVSVLAYAIHGSCVPMGAELLGAGRRRLHSIVAVSAGFTQCLVAVSALWIGAFARPLGFGVASAGMLAAFFPFRRALYRDDLDVRLAGVGK